MRKVAGVHVLTNKEGFIYISETLLYLPPSLFIILEFQQFLCSS